MYIYICFTLFPLLYYNYSFIYLYKGYASYIHISRGYVKHKKLRTTALKDVEGSDPGMFQVPAIVGVQKSRNCRQ
jgi:hypothetical protein